MELDWPKCLELHSDQKKSNSIPKKLGECQTIMPLQEKEITKEFKPWPIKRIKAAISHFRN
jgi:hypothetical protein